MPKMTIDDALHRLLLDNLTTATILLNANLRLEYMNPAAEMLLAVSGQRSHGQFISELFSESPEALSALRHAVEHAHPGEHDRFENVDDVVEHERRDRDHRNR